MLERLKYILTMNKLSNAKRTAVVAALVEGNSIRSTVRMTGVAKNTVTKLLVDLSRACDAYQRRELTGLRCRRIQCDEIWSFVYAKERNAIHSFIRSSGVVGTFVVVAELKPASRNARSTCPRS